ncbi:MAG: anti-sigma factor [Candidatus Omnitrophota bacterium]
MKECSRVKRLLSRYADGESGDAEAFRLRRHLDICPSCREELAGLVKIKETISCGEKKTLPADYLLCRLRDRIARTGGRKREWCWSGAGDFSLRFIPVPVTAIALSFLLLVASFGRSPDTYSLEDYVLSGSRTNTAAVLVLMLGQEG